MLRAAGFVLLATLAGAAPANAAPPSVTISASAPSASAPLTVPSSRPSGDAADHTTGSSATARPRTAPPPARPTAPGLWTATVTATAGDGETAQASVMVRSVAVTLLPAAESRYGRPAAFQGKSRAGARRRAGGALPRRTRGGRRARRRRRHLRFAAPARSHARAVRGADAGRGFGAGRARGAPRAADDVRRCAGRRRAAGARRPRGARSGGHDLDPPLPRRHPRAQGPCRRRDQACRGHRPHRRLPRHRSRRAREGMAGSGAHRARRRPLCAATRPTGRRSRVPELPRRRLPVPAAAELRGAQRAGLAAAVRRRASARVRAARPCRPHRRRGLLGVRLPLRGRAGALEVGVRAGRGRAGVRPRRCLSPRPGALRRGGCLLPRAPPDAADAGSRAAIGSASTGSPTR